jgi:ferredoxin
VKELETSVEVSIDQALCRGDCVCELICPQVFVLDEDGIAYATEGELRLEGPKGWARVPAGLESQAMDAVNECPTQAISVRDAEADADRA